MMTDVSEINIDVISELRTRGKRHEANELIQKFRENVKSNSKQLRSEMIAREQKIKYVKGICKNCDRDRLLHSPYCQVHFDKRKEYAQKYKEVMKNE